MSAEKAIWFRPAWGYAAAAVCVALAAWGAASPSPTLGIVQVLDQTDRDMQLPLERFAVEAANTAASSSQALRQPQRQLPAPSPGQSPQHGAQRSPQDRRMSDYVPNWTAGTDNGFARLGTPRRKTGAPGYYRKTDDHKNWT